MSPRPRLTDAETDEHARQLVEATFRLVAATGDAAPSVRDILEEAGLGRQAFYRCFSSKDELMAAAIDEGGRRLIAYLRGRMSDAATPEGRVRAWIDGLMRQARSATERTRPFIVAPPGRVHDSGTHEEVSGLLAQAIAAGVEAGSFGSADPRADAVLIHDYVFASMRRHLVRDVRPSREEIRHLEDFAIRGLRPGAVPAS